MKDAKALCKILKRAPISNVLIAKRYSSMADSLVVMFLGLIKIPPIIKVCTKNQNTAKFKNLLKKHICY